MFSKAQVPCFFPFFTKAGQTRPLSLKFPSFPQSVLKSPPSDLPLLPQTCVRALSAFDPSW